MITLHWLCVHYEIATVSPYLHAFVYPTVLICKLSTVMLKSEYLQGSGSTER